jgi:hypothetical protein
MSDEGNDSEKMSMVNQEDRGSDHNHIQIQMYYPPGSAISCLMRRQIASMSEILECNNKAILILI